MIVAFSTIITISSESGMLLMTYLYVRLLCLQSWYVYFIYIIVYIYIFMLTIMITCGIRVIHYAKNRMVYFLLFLKHIFLIKYAIISAPQNLYFLIMKQKFENFKYDHQRILRR